MSTESNQLAVVNPQKISALNIMASRLGADQEKLLGTLKATVFKNATNEELLALVVVANQYGLNPLTKEIYAFPAKGGGIVPVVSVDGWINLMNSHPMMDGIEQEFREDEKGDPISCTTIIYRKDRSHPIKKTEYFSECSRPTEPWKMKHRMLGHKSLIQTARVAFGFAGIYDEEEAQVIADRVEHVVNQPARPIFSAPKVETIALPGPTAETVQAVVVEGDNIPMGEPLQNLQQSEPLETPPKNEAQAPQERKLQAGESVWTETLMDVTEKSGATQAGKKWTIYTLDFGEGRKATTFDVTLADEAVSFISGVVKAIVKPGKKEGQWDFVGFLRSGETQGERDADGNFNF